MSHPLHLWDIDFLQIQNTWTEYISDQFLPRHATRRIEKLAQTKLLLNLRGKCEFCKLEWYFRRAETSRIVLKVNSNPRQLNATAMAKILDADAALKEHAKNDLALEIKSFEVGDANVSLVWRLL